MSHRSVLTRRSWLLAGALSGIGATLRTASAAQWPAEREAGAFRCHADFALEPYDRLWKELAALQEDLARDLALPAPHEEIHLFLFSRKETYQGYLNQYFPKVPARRALFIKGRGPGMVFVHRSGELEIDVRHECTHALLHTYVSDIPLWLDEGLAEYYETAAAERVARSPYASTVRWNARMGYVPDLGKLERLSDVSEMGQNDYRDAWAWTHLLLHGSGETRTVLREYLQVLAHAPSAGKLSEHFRRRIGATEALFTSHFREWKVGR